MTKFNQIDAGKLFVDLTSYELDAVNQIYQVWSDNMFDCVKYDCVDDSGIFKYWVDSILSRHDFVTAMLTSLIDGSYQANDIMLDPDNMLLVLFDIKFVLDCELDIILEVAMTDDVVDRVDMFEQYVHGKSALAKINKLLS